MRWEDTPYWSERLLQGLAFWVGYKSELYHYPLTEGAIVGEAAALLNGQLDREYKLMCERMYKRMNCYLLGNGRADLVIEKEDQIDSVIEVKRGKESDERIRKDFRRLATYHTSNPKVRCYLLLASQRKRPKEFVTLRGNACTKEIQESNYIASVRRVCKASPSFKMAKGAHYACLIEVKSEAYSRQEEFKWL